MSKLHMLAAAALAPLIALPAQAQTTASPAQYGVTLSSYAYSPKPIRLTAGQPVTMVFVNRSGSGHDFTAREFFAASKITGGAAPGGEIELRGGETKSLTLIPARGTYRVHCGHFMHSAFGMTDQIIVQ